MHGRGPTRQKAFAHLDKFIDAAFKGAMVVVCVRVVAGPHQLEIESVNTACVPVYDIGDFLLSYQSLKIHT